MATQIASLFAKVSADTSNFDRGMTGVNRQINGVSSVLKGLAIGAAAAATAIGVGLVGTIVKATQSAMGMEQQLANIKAAMGLTNEETDKFKKLILDLGLDPKLQVTATEAANAIEMLGKNGLTVDQILQGAARSTVLLANATGGDFALAADVATSAMQAFGIDASHINAAVSNISGTLVASKFDINDYALALSQGGGVAAAVGVTFEDFNATIAAISPLFGSGSDAGTSFKVFLQRLIPQSNDAKDAMMQLGIITADGANRFFDASGNMQSMSMIAGILQVAMSGLSDEQKNNALSTIFGTDAMRAAAAIAQVGEQKFAALKETIGKTDAEKQAATRMDTLSGRIEILRGVLETIALKIGEKFMPAVEKIVAWIQEMVIKYEPQIDSFFAGLADNVTSFVTDFIANWPQIQAVAKQTLKDLKPALDGAMKLFEKFSDWFGEGESKKPFAWMTNFIQGIGIVGKYIGDWASTGREFFSSISAAMDALRRGDFGGAVGLWQKAGSIGSKWMSQDLLPSSDTIMKEIEGRANGGLASGWTMVGERGPELVNLPGGSYVNSASQTQRMMQGTQITIQNLNMQGGSSGLQNLATVTSTLSAMYG